MDASELHAKCSALAPIAGVTVGDPADKATWRVDFLPGATAEQRASVSDAILGIDVSAPPVPASVRMWQAKAALAASGKLDAANAAISAASIPALSIAWEYATDVSRDSPGMLAIGEAIGLNQQDIDALFIAAEQIKA